MSFLVCWKYEFSADTMPNHSPMSIHDFIVSDFNLLLIMILHCVNFNQWIFMILLNQNLTVQLYLNFFSPLVLRWLVHFNYRQGEVVSGAHHLQIRVLPLQSVLGHTAELIGTHINANAYSKEIQSRSPCVAFSSTWNYLDKNST